jgi:hypothetical protein
MLQIINDLRKGLKPSLLSINLNLKVTINSFEDFNSPIYQLQASLGEIFICFSKNQFSLCKELFDYLVESN